MFFSFQNTHKPSYFNNSTAAQRESQSPSALKHCPSDMRVITNSLNWAQSERRRLSVDPALSLTPWRCCMSWSTPNLLSGQTLHLSRGSTRAVGLVKGIVLTKMLICRKCTHPQAIQDVAKFDSSWEQIWRNVALHHLLTNGSSAVNGCRQNGSPNSW